LKRVGLGRVIGYSLADVAQWRKEGIDLTRISTEWCANLRRILQNDPSLQLVDVRSRAEWLKGRLPGASYVPLLDLDSGSRSIDPRRVLSIATKDIALRRRPASCYERAPATSAF